MVALGSDDLLLVRDYLIHNLVVLGVHCVQFRFLRFLLTEHLEKIPSWSRCLFRIFVLNMSHF